MLKNKPIALWHRIVACGNFVYNCFVLRNFIFLLFLLFVSFAFTAQEALIVYPTYDDFKNGAGTVYKGSYEHTFSFSFLNFRAHFKNRDTTLPREKKKVVLKGEELWGFSSNGRLYRCYWRNAAAYVPYYNQDFVIYVLPEDRELPYVNSRFGPVTFYDPYGVYISKDFNSGLLNINGKRKSKRFLRKLKEMFPDETLFHSLATCIATNRNYKDKLACMGFIHD